MTKGTKKGHRCRVCGKIFPKPHGRVVHMRIKHGEKAKPTASRSPRPRTGPSKVHQFSDPGPRKNGSQDQLIDRLRERAKELRQTADEIDVQIREIQGAVKKYLN